MAETAPGVLELKGEELSAVAFVRDYVEFHFDGPVLRAFTNPEVVLSTGAVARFPGPGSCDALRALIGSTVRAVRFEEERAIELQLEPAGVLRISLAPEQRPEAATYQRQAVHSPLEVY